MSLSRTLCTPGSLLLVGLLAAAGAWASEPLGTPDPRSIEYPDGLPPDAALVDLGRELFFETRMSRNNNQSCATCHNPDLGFGDGVALGRGTDGVMLPRNTPHLYNLAFNVVFFWDGRAATLEQQALGPIQSKKEMNMPLDLMVSKLESGNGYSAKFKATFGSDGVTADRVAQALAAFERTIVSRNSAFDRYLAGDHEAMGPEAQRGLALFGGKAQCTQCHDGPNFTDNSFHNIGLQSADAGRATIVKDPTLTGAFKTPGLRNVALTAPYMHDGSEASLESVVRYYNRGGDVATNRDKLIKPLKLDEQEVRDIVAFLGALTDPVTIRRPQPSHGE